MINERIVIEEKTKDYNEAWIETYFWQESEELYPGQKRPVIVICPGGAYGMTSDREAEAIAVRAITQWCFVTVWHLPDIRWPSVSWQKQ